MLKHKNLLHHLLSRIKTKKIANDRKVIPEEIYTTLINFHNNYFTKIKEKGIKKTSI